MCHPFLTDSWVLPNFSRWEECVPQFCLPQFVQEVCVTLICSGGVCHPNLLFAGRCVSPYFIMKLKGISRPAVSRR